MYASGLTQLFGHNSYSSSLEMFNITFLENSFRIDARYFRNIFEKLIVFD